MTRDDVTMGDLYPMDREAAPYLGRGEAGRWWTASRTNGLGLSEQEKRECSEITPNDIRHGAGPDDLESYDVKVMFDYIAHRVPVGVLQ